MNRSPFSHEIEPTPTEVICVADIKAIAGESPVWSVAEQSLYSVDHQGHKIHRLTPSLDNKIETFDLPGVVTSLAIRKKGGLIITVDRKMALFDPDRGELTTICEVDTDLPDNRFNDGKCDRKGRFWAGTMGNSAWDSPIGNLYKLDSDNALTTMVAGVKCSNGLAWSPDNRTFYYAESFAYIIHAFDHDPESGELSNKRMFAKIDPESGSFPDGITIDVEGYIWNAQPVFGRIVRYAPDGTIDKIIELPISWGTSCIFGGPDMDIMYVTTSRETLSEEDIAQEPLAGGIFAFKPGVAGFPEPLFEG